MNAFEQAVDEVIPNSRFRRQYRALTDYEQTLHNHIKEQAAVLEGLILHIRPGRYPALALTALEESVMWAIKGVTE